MKRSRVLPADDHSEAEERGYLFEVVGHGETARRHSQRIPRRQTVTSQSTIRCMSLKWLRPLKLDA
jgi:hypothetical protein